MTQINYVEDYITFIGGSGTDTSPINLARYDKPIVASFTQQIFRGQALTDKQAGLALKLVTKYRKQISALDPPVIIAGNLNFRLGIRQIDRTRKAFIENNEILIRFPYDTAFINLLKEYSRNSNGYCYFNFDKKLWTMSITEDNVNWLVSVANNQDLQLDQPILDLFHKITEVEQQSYNIMLTTKDNDVNNLTITNAAEGLIQYINLNLGGFGIANLQTLVDYASVLGYAVQQELLNIVQPNFTQLQRKILQSRYEIIDRDFDLEQVIDYARATNRLPIYLYGALRKSNREEIIDITAKTELDNCRPKLFISLTGILIGQRRQAWLTASEKVVIFNGSVTNV